MQLGVGRQGRHGRLDALYFHTASTRRTPESTNPLPARGREGAGRTGPPFRSSGG
ncbi:hypothetical protein ISF6_2715 [Piscinibacter sakaiensis]|uniref:Uncharacterized protein n=1 Tax=Piscinibacter sakaiensis TaxID=1547922 RepID=A0A0K8P3R2_PISS1|nr:hypothetical protein ISF6_2715 [Piscinibacter sakaiensis]